jgi:hypothetical protein
MRIVAALVASVIAPLALALAVASVPDIPTVRDNDESLDVLNAVEAAVPLPADAVMARMASTSRRFLLVYGVEAPGTQERILSAARDARRLHSSRPVEVVFHSATVVTDGHGGATFPNGTREIRRERVP